MAKSGLQINQEIFSCTICSELLEDPVTIPCGHSYCMSCVNTHWDGEVSKPGYSCPQCRQSFTQRPVLVKNTMLAVLVEGLKKTRLPVPPDHHCYAEPEDVACDMCSGRKKKAVKCCLQCLVSYCKEHIQPHYDVAALKKHKLIDPTENLLDNICSRHNEVMKMFCRTDQQCICYLCSVEEHKSHETVSVAAERTERQREFNDIQQKIHQRIQEKKREVNILETEITMINLSAERMVESSRKSEECLIYCIENIITDMDNKIESQLDTEVLRIKELQDKKQQEINELKMKYAELEKLSQTEDHYEFLQSFLSLDKLSEDSDSPSINKAPMSFDFVTATVTDIKTKIQDSKNQINKLLLRQGRTKTSSDLVSLSGAQFADDPTHELDRPRHEFLQDARDITFDPNTVSSFIVLSNENKKARNVTQQQKYHKNPERFSSFAEALSKEPLTGRCYFEMKGKFRHVLTVGVTYKDILRKGPFDECIIGKNDKSWAIECWANCVHYFWHNKTSKKARTDTIISRIGFYLDHDAGILAFYTIDDRMTLIHKIHTVFTQPLYAAVYFEEEGDSVEICKLKLT